MKKNNKFAGVYKLLRVVGLWLGIGTVLFLFYYFTGHGIPCVFHEVTGLYCPGCGLTRAVYTLLVYGDIKQAFGYNAMLFIAGPILLFIAVRWGYYTIKQKDYTLSKFECIITIILLVLLLVFSILRNIPMFSMLAPV